jgi:hypothetical protein
MRAAAVCFLISMLAATRLAAEEGLSAAELAAARKLYAVKCAKCHKFYEPVDYSQADWAEWMEKMRRKAKLKPEQFDLLSRYLEEARASGTRVGGKSVGKK